MMWLVVALVCLMILYAVAFSYHHFSRVMSCYCFGCITLLITNPLLGHFGGRVPAIVSDLVGIAFYLAGGWYASPRVPKPESREFTAGETVLALVGLCVAAPLLYLSMLRIPITTVMYSLPVSVLFSAVLPCLGSLFFWATRQSKDAPVRPLVLS